MEAPPRSFPVVASKPLTCARCETPLQAGGTKYFQADADAGFVTGIGSLFANCDRLDICVCPRCGKLEFFVGVTQDRPVVSGVVPLAPESPRPVNAPASVERLLDEGTRFLRRGQVENAVPYLEEVTVRFPGTIYARDAEQQLREIREKQGI